MNNETIIVPPRMRWSGLPTVAVAGRPNVGKSTLFNRLLRSRRAIVDPTPGVTRDPIEAQWTPDGADMPVLLVDTGGLKIDRNDMDERVAKKSWERIASADLVLFLLDAVDVTPEDEEFAAMLRRYSDKVVLVINKADSPERDARAWNHASWGYKDMVFVSAEHGRNIDELEELIVSRLDWSKAECKSDEHDDVRVAIMGKPNVGKSTLLNKLLGEDRSIVSDMPGTTRDVVEARFVWKGKTFTVLDTAGMRRKAKVTEDVEYYSVNRAVKTLDRADVVILMIDASEGLSDQDKKIVKLATDKGRGVVFALNKWDEMPRIKNAFEAAKDKLQFFFGQMAYAPVLPLSARDGEGVEKLLRTVVEVFDQLNLKIETSRLNKAVQEWVESSPPPASPRSRFKLRYAVQTGSNPVSFALFATRPELVGDSYRSYLKNKLRSELGFKNVPLEVEFRASRKRFEDLDKG
ncbi:MAG: ribosome biogenesis GTPase Der [Spirochaetae bacterium HGW-Spirochaetae-7]|jgi:GTP-binding protein|nr:MAG: ribosome biogenesis GTPase Der [Spirochaetae bacterium HGW-Spirochaetae-7]